MSPTLSFVNFVALAGGAMAGAAVTLRRPAHRSIDRPGPAVSPAVMAVCALAGILTGLSMHWPKPEWAKAFAFGGVAAAGSMTLAINSPSAIRSRADVTTYLKRASLSLAANVACGVAFAAVGLIFVRGALHIMNKFV
ncbi:hypothetical protein [Mycolicibacterium stellerae]|uniref:hypothetical protein n=1 Tax=Mycolicibacterium stellerae TaxID=2358193 RepID=UPI000F0BA659|nr:hypothetical protein [Mycolicibacterium stellerae]